MTTPITGMPEIVESQALKHLTHNAALRRLEAIGFRVLSRQTVAEPTTPAAGDSYIIPASATGTNWAGQDGNVTYYDGSAWHFLAPFEGLGVWINDENQARTYDGAAWIASAGATSFLGLSDSPSAYTGSAGLALRVNAGASALEFFAAAAEAHTHPVNDLEQGTGTDGQVPTLQTDGSVAWATPPGASGGEANTAANVGTGDGWYKQKSGTELQFKSVIAGDGVAATAGTDAITITSNTETVHAATTSLDRADGGIQTLTLTADSTLSVAINEGQSLTLHLSGGATYTVTWPTMTWVGGSAPTLTAADVIEFWKVGTTLYGAYVGSIA